MKAYGLFLTLISVVCFLKLLKSNSYGAILAFFSLMISLTLISN